MFDNIDPKNKKQQKNGEVQFKLKMKLKANLMYLNEKIFTLKSINFMKLLFSTNIYSTFHKSILD